MKNVVGGPARGESFFRRKKEIEEIISRLQNGNNLQLTAPRRVGKTSILYYLLDNAINNYVYVHIDTESINETQLFFKKLLKELLKTEAIAKSGPLKKALQEGKKFLKAIKSIRIIEAGIEFNETETNYAEEVSNFLAGIELGGDTQIVLLIDEFPQTILNIIMANGGDTQKTIEFLQLNRELRQNPDINTKVKFIYTGSIGLNHTVSAIQASAFINDLNAVEIGPLSTEDAESLVKILLQPNNISIDADALGYLLTKIQWLIPFHIQLAVQELLSLAAIGANITVPLVDTSFLKILEARNNNHFDHYYSRLKSQFKDDSYRYANELLQKMAVSGTLSANELYSMSAKYDLESKYKQILEILAYDGYINNVGDLKVYQFNSPIVRMWWQKFVCN